MSERDDVQERLFDVLLGEVEGRGPDDRLVARTLASVERPERGMAAAATARSPRWLLVAAVLAVGVVATLAVVTQGEGAVGRGAGAGDEATMGAGGDAAPQDPRARTPEQCIEALRDDGQRDAAVRELARGGPQAVRVMIAALGDAEAPREHVLAAIEQMGAGAAAALPAITALIRATPKHDAVLGPAVSAAATLAPFGSEVERHDARRAVLFLAFIDNGPADGGAVVKRARAGGGGGAGPAQRKGPAFSMRDVARLLHRIELPREASTEALLAALAGDSPYGRELAAQLLVGHDSPQVREALRDAVIAEHPRDVRVKWEVAEGFSGQYGYVQQYDSQIRSAAARSLAKLADGEPIAARAQVALLRAGALQTRRAAAAALARTQVDARDLDAVAAAVVAALRDEDPLLLRELVVVAGRLPTLPAEVRAALERLAEHPDRQVAARAAAALR